MKLAISTEGEKVSSLFLPFGLLEIVEIVEGQVVGKNIVDASGDTKDSLGQFLKSNSVDGIITGGIENDLLNNIEKLKLIVLPNVEGNVEEIIKDFMEGKLTSDKASCSGCSSCKCGHK